MRVFRTGLRCASPHTGLTTLSVSKLTCLNTRQFLESMQSLHKSQSLKWHIQMHNQMPNRLKTISFCETCPSLFQLALFRCRFGLSLLEAVGSVRELLHMKRQKENGVTDKNNCWGGENSILTRVSTCLSGMAGDLLTLHNIREVVDNISIR